MKIDRKIFDNTIGNMFSNPDYSGYVFYAHILAQCDIKFDNSMPAPAGVSFNINRYILWMNLDHFGNYPLEHRLGILKHEMLHILNNHVVRSEDRIHLPWNIASDLAINQFIERKHLPEEGCHFDKDPFNYPAKLSSENYYELLKQDAENQKQEDCPACGGSGEQEGEDGQEPCKCCNGTGKTQGNYRQIGDHSKWQESTGDNELRRDITKTMIEKAISKSRGNVPSNISDMLSLFSRTSQVSWKKVLKNIASNKKANSRRTIKKQHRRFPDREDLKGKTKDRTFDLAVIWDVSGSMSNEEGLKGLSEISAICKMTNSSLKLVQVDTQAQEPEDFTKKTKKITRKANGGTYLYPAIEKLRERKIHFDALVVITDGGTEDVSRWDKPPKCRVIFLTTDSDIPGIGNTKFKQFNLN